MPELAQQLSKTQAAFEEQMEKVASLKDLEAVRIAFLGKQGSVQALFKGIKSLSVDEKKEIVPKLNALKQMVDEKIKEKKQEIIEQKAHAASLKQKNFDVTASVPGVQKGHVHPYTQFTQEVEDIFISMGYEKVDGPFVETDHYNFTALNIPPDHPARDMHDTFWLTTKSRLLRTHTSTMQIRAMEKQKPPIAIFAPGVAFRHEAVDATHDSMFMQCEGMIVDKGITLSHLFATAQTFLKKLFKTDELDIRIRPGFFPFVEPGVEIDMRCPFCESGCGVCKKSTWIEVFPGGMVHPNVLKAGGIDPEVYSGIAFGFGLTRLAMLKYKINDIRLLLSGKLKFLEQF